MIYDFEEMWERVYLIKTAECFFHPCLFATENMARGQFAVFDEATQKEMEVIQVDRKDGPYKGLAWMIVYKKKEN